MPTQPKFRKLLPGAYLPALSRSVPLTADLAKKLDPADPAKRVIDILFASEVPAERWFGREILDCSPEAVDLSRLNNGGAFLSEHDTDRQIGVHVPNSARMARDATGARVGLASVRFGNSPLAQQELLDVRDEVRTLISVSYLPHRMILESSDEELGDTYRVVKWEPLENSLVAIPVDTNARVQKSIFGQENALTFPVDVVIADESSLDANTENPMNARRRSFFMPSSATLAASALMAPDAGGGNGGGTPPAPAVTVTVNAPEPATPTPATPPAPTQSPAASSVTVTTPSERGTDAERTRLRELSALGVRYPAAAQRMVEFINDGSSVEVAQRYVMETLFRPGATPVNALERANQSGTSATQTLGQILTEHPRFRTDIVSRPDSRRSLSLNVEGISQIRAVLTTSGLVTPDNQPGIQQLRTQPLTIADLLAPGTTTTGQVRYLQETTFTNAAATVAEGGLKPEASFSIAPATADVKKIAVTARVTDEMLEDNAQVRSFIDARLGLMVGITEEAELLNGSGTGTHLKGILNQTGIQTKARDSANSEPEADALFRAMTAVQVNSFFTSSGMVMHPNNFAFLKLSKDANGQYLGGGPVFLPYGNGAYVSFERIWGVPVVVTTAIAQGTALVGAFNVAAQLFRRSGIVIESTNSHESDFAYNQIAIRAEERLALAVYRPPAFCTITGLRAIA